MSEKYGEKPESVCTLVDEHIKRIHSEDEDRNTHIHVTDLSGCLCGVFLKKRGMQVEEREGIKRRYEVGHMAEELIANAIFQSEQYEELPHNKVQLTWDELGMVGTPDIVAMHIPTNTPTLMEIKTVHVFAIDKMDEPYPHHVEQVLLYHEKLKQMYGPMRKTIAYFALDGRMKEFEVQDDPFVVEDAMKRAQELRDCLATGKRPDPAPDIITVKGKRQINWAAKYCMLDGIHNYCIGDMDMTYGQWEYRAKKKL